MFRVGECVRVNGGRHYGLLGTIQSIIGSGYDARYTVFVSGVGCIETDRVLPPTANNGD